VPQATLPITEIVKEAIPEMAITPESLHVTICEIDNLEPSQQLSLGPLPPSILWRATETTGFPHTHSMYIMSTMLRKACDT